MPSLLDGPKQWIKKAGLFEGQRASHPSDRESAFGGASLSEVAGHEWLTTNRHGSFAFGAVDRCPRRKYHSLLTLSQAAAAESLNLLIDLGERIELSGRKIELHQLRFSNDVSVGFPESLVDFAFEPGPCWYYDFNSARMRRFVQLDEHEGVCIYYRIEAVAEPMTISLLPFLACRPVHDLVRINPVLNGQVRIESRGFSIEPYHGVPRLFFALEGHEFHFEANGAWYRSVDYELERERGYGASEDLFVPGELSLRVEGDAELAVWIGTQPAPHDFATARRGGAFALRSPSPVTRVLSKAVSSATATVSSATAAVSSRLGLYAASEERLSDRLGRATQAFKVRGDVPSVIAGYPWFGSRSRDLLLSLPGAFLAQGDRAGALERLELLAGCRASGLLPNDFSKPAPTLDAVDPSLLFVDVVRRMSRERWDDRLSALMPIVCDIFDALRAGGDARVSVTESGELHLDPGPWALSWMDVTLDAAPVVRRAGFLVELNALLVSGLRFAVSWAKEHDRAFATRWALRAERASRSFVERFCSSSFPHLADAHDGQRPDLSLRPNQLWALANGDLPIPSAFRAKALEAVRTQLLTPVGVRTLSPFDPEYQATYQGDFEKRDRAYHQGTSWPFLLGLYADSVLLVHGDGHLRDELEPIFARLAHHLDAEACLGQVSECFDGDAPHFPGGAPAHAASAAELYRVAKMVGM